MAEVRFYNFLGSYNKAYKSKSIDEKDFSAFIKNLRDFFAELEMVDKTNEEMLKNIFNKYLLKNYNTLLNENRIDLSIKKDNKTQVIFEFKSPNNKSEMLQADSEIVNKKALQEAIWYFYNQDSKEISYNIKNVVITDTEHLFFFNPKQFCNKDLEKICLQFRNNQVAYTDTRTLYDQIGSKIKDKNIQFEYTEFNLIQYKSKILNNLLNDNDKRLLQYLYKALHPDFLLREYSPKDSNELNNKFYNELLYILGLKEEGKTQKKIVTSDVKGTLRDRISYDLNCKKFDDVINLIIVWLNRLLFLKLFESQLISFNGNDKSYAFLNFEKIPNFAKLNRLFFNVLGKPLDQREEHEIPYLNSSLFERSELESKYGNISNLDSEITLPLCKGSILSKVKNYPKNPTLLKYLLDFLEAYNFSSNITENDDKKDIINSSVLGLIFEKLNGYKDGSFFTPAYITEYMAETSINNIVLQKFNNALGEEKAPSKTIDDLKSLIRYDVHIKERRDFYNRIIDSLKICDPAVGSGHFLVSVLNYIVALKSELGLLSVPNKIEIQNDSLVVYEQDGETQFEYKRNNKNSLTVQKAIFDEKRKIIENCLFGVDINPNSVQICCLRLWIELLKNTYYIDNTDEMQILPNIDINIKCGNSLVSAYEVKVGHCALESLDGRTAEAKSIKEYKNLVAEYKSSESKILKSDLKIQIRAIKDKIFPIRQLNIFEDNSNQGIYKNSLEWMIEFPELLDENGVFNGYDLVIGNPPYIQIQKFKNDPIQNAYKNGNFETLDSNGDIYCLFYEKGINILKQEGYLCFITSNKWMRAGYGEKLREFFINKCNPIKIIDFAGITVFDTATVDVNIILLSKSSNEHKTKSCMIKNSKQLSKLIEVADENYINQDFSSKPWTILNPIEKSIKEKIEKLGKPLKEWDINIYRGILTGLNEAFIINGQKKDELIKKDPKSAEIIKPILRGRDVKRYHYEFADTWLINTHNGTTTEKRIDVNNYPAIKEHLDKFYDRLEKRDDKGDTPYNLRCCSYMDDFSKQKIVWGNLCLNTQFAFAEKEYIINAPTSMIIPGDKYILAILNSNVADFYIRNLGVTRNGGYFEYKPMFIKEMPIPNINDEEKEKYIKLVNKIENNYNSIELQKELNSLIYNLYELSNDESNYLEQERIEISSSVKL